MPGAGCVPSKLRSPTDADRRAAVPAGGPGRVRTAAKSQVKGHDKVMEPYREMTRYRAYQGKLAGQPVEGTFRRATAFLRLAAEGSSLSRT